MEETIEVGAADGDYRLWAAKEAVRQGELKLANQTSTLAAAEGRAASLLTWSLGILTAIIAVMASHRRPDQLLMGTLTALPLIVAQFLCIRALWPKIWCESGYQPEEVMAWELTSELEALERIAIGCQVGIEENQKALSAFQICIRRSWCCFFAFAPIALTVLAAHFFFWRFISFLA